MGGYRWNWGIFFARVPTGDATYLDWLLAGLRTTVALSLSAWALALGIGVLMGVLRTVPNRTLARLAGTYVEAFRNVPLLVQLFLWYFVLPDIAPGGWHFKQLDPAHQQFIASALCLAFFTAARVCEQVRSGIQSIPTGMRSASLALGLTLPQTYRFVLLPLALRIIIPPLSSELVNIFKNSAVCSTIGLLELAAQGRQLLDYTQQAYESFLAVTLLYAAVNAVALLAMRQLETRLRVPGMVGRAS
jgi:glutamate/aspartate transport system permease protein